MEKTIYLTFDDGPNEPYTSGILKILGDFGAKATFFVCGRNVEKFPESLKEIAVQGHCLGNHSYSHNLITVLLGGKKLKDEVALTNRLIKQHTGRETNLYRSPWGLTVPWIRPWLRQNGFKLFFWDFLTFDWRKPSADFIADRVIKKVFPGAVVLLHDGDQTNGGDRFQTVKALPIILRELTKQGYRFKTL